MSLNALHKMMIFIGAFLVVLAVAPVNAAEEREFKPVPSAPDKPVNVYGFETGIIRYDLKSPIAPGSRTVTFSQQGHLLREESHRTLPSGKAQNEFIIMQGNNIYYLYPEFNIAVLEKGQRGSANIDVEAVAQQVGGREKAMESFKAAGISFLDSAEILGHLCQVWTREDAIHKVTMWGYKGFPMRIQALRKGADGTFKLEEEITAVEASFDTEVDPALFELPANYQIRTREEIEQKKMEQELLGKQGGQSNRPMILKPETQ